MKREGTDRQITRLIQEDPVAWGVTPPEDASRAGRLWDTIQQEGLRAARKRRIRRTCLYVTLNLLALFVGSLLAGFLWDASGVQAFREGLTRDIRTHGNEISIEYREDNPRESEGPYEPIHMEGATLADVEALDVFIPIPKSLPEDIVFLEAEIVSFESDRADVRLIYLGPEDTLTHITCLYGERNMSMHTECDRIQTYEWDGIEITHFIQDDRPTDIFIWHIGDYMFEVIAGMDLTEARALFDDLNVQVYEDWKKGDW